jgi:(1->4)-alpha-D-glucan 1-alpha-D-glucosylmutase
MGLAEGWGDTRLALPDTGWTNRLTSENHRGGTLSIADLLGAFPVAVLAR